MQSRYRSKFRKLLFHLFELKPKTAVLRPLFSLIFYGTWYVYSIGLPTLPINHKDNVFITKGKQRIDRIFNLEKIIQNVLVLDNKRLERRRNDFKAIRYNLNLKSTKEFIAHELSLDQMKKDINEIMLINSVKWKLSNNFFKIEPKYLAGISIRNLQGNLIATCSGFFTKDFFNIEYLLTIASDYSLSSRWVLHEKIVDMTNERGYGYIRISNYQHTSLKNLYFNQRLGYKDFNLK